MTARRLVLLRHAKAENPPGLADEDRPLSARGRADAQAAGVWLARRHVPELVLCSPSKRTRQTWHGLVSGLGQAPAPGGPPVTAAPAVRYERGLYLGTVDELLTIVREIDESAATVLMIGHNPALSQLAFAFDPDGGMDSDGLRTCGLTVHEVAGAWSDYRPRHAPIITSHIARG